MKIVRMLLVVLLFLLTLSFTAFGGGYTIQTPGRLPAYATPNFGGGYTVRLHVDYPLTLIHNEYGLLNE